MKLLPAAPPDEYYLNFSLGGNGTSYPSGPGVCATDTVTNNVINAGGFSPAYSVYCECNTAGTACDNASFGGQWPGNTLTGGAKCTRGDACENTHAGGTSDQKLRANGVTPAIEAGGGRLWARHSR
jgi:hypothetical protein